MGVYNMAFNLADIPAVQVGEQIALVLLPSMAELPRDRRAAALERSTALLSLVLFPLAVGLGLVAHALIAVILPANQWQEVAPLLTVLACISVFRPITWVLSGRQPLRELAARDRAANRSRSVVLVEEELLPGQQGPHQGRGPRDERRAGQAISIEQTFEIVSNDGYGCAHSKHRVNG